MSKLDELINWFDNKGKTSRKHAFRYLQITKQSGTKAAMARRTPKRGAQHAALHIPNGITGSDLGVSPIFNHLSSKDIRFDGKQNRWRILDESSKV